MEPRPGRQCVDDQNEIARSTFRVGITAVEGEGQSAFQAQPLGKRGDASLDQYGMKALWIKLAVQVGPA
jgi:hypothetical protein